MHAFIELAECRRHDLLADAARARLAKEAQLNQLSALPAQEIARNAARVACSTARSILASLTFHSFGRGLMRREQTMLPSAR